MDFTLTDEQTAISELAAPDPLRAAAARAPPRARGRPTTWFADDVWAELAKADLLGIALPEADGGGGLRLPRGVPARRAGRPHRAPRCRTCRCIVGSAPCRSPSSAPPSSRPRSCRASSPGRPILTVGLSEAGDGRAAGRARHPGHARPATAGASPARSRFVRRRRPCRPRSCVAGPHRRRTAAPCSWSTRRRPASRSSRSAPSPASRQWTVAPRRRAPSAPTTCLGDVGRRRRRSSRWITDRPSAARSAPRRPACARPPCAITAAYTCERKQFGTPDRHLPGRRPPDRRRLHRHRGDAPHRPPGRLAPGRRARPPPTSWSSPSSGRPRAPSAWCTPPSTCTAASASTSTTRSTATSGGPRCSSSRLGGASPSLLRLGASLASQPVGTT